MTPLVPADLGAGVVAGFTTAGANLSLVVGDTSATRLHRAELERAVGAPLVLVRQVHGTGVHVAGADAVQAPRDELGTVGEGDVVLATGPDVAVAVLVADCVPLLLADAAAGVVAAVHAGRRGLAAGVVGRAVAEIVAHGAQLEDVRAVVGPAICGSCYEVPADLRDDIDALVPGTAATTSWGTPALDLPAGVAAELARHGVRTVRRTGWCTRTDARWYSHRAAAAAEGRPGGRFAGVVRLLPR